MFWEKEEDAPEESDNSIVECGTCGYKGPMKDFLEIDPGDTRCPVCREDENLIHEI